MSLWSEWSSYEALKKSSRNWFFTFWRVYTQKTGWRITRITFLKRYIVEYFSAKSVHTRASTSFKTCQRSRIHRTLTWKIFCFTNCASCGWAEKKKLRCLENNWTALRLESNWKYSTSSTKYFNEFYWQSCDGESWVVLQYH